jgi:hypothetical protein
MMAKFTPRQRKHKHKNHDGQSTTAQVDSNVLEILPISKAEKEERRQKLREELRIQQPNISAKKKKRLDKYIVCQNVTWHLLPQLTSGIGKQTKERRKSGNLEEACAK